MMVIFFNSRGMLDAQTLRPSEQDLSVKDPMSAASYEVGVEAGIRRGGKGRHIRNAVNSRVVFIPLFPGSSTYLLQ